MDCFHLDLEWDLDLERDDSREGLDSMILFLSVWIVSRRLDCFDLEWDDSREGLDRGILQCTVYAGLVVPFTLLSRCFTPPYMKSRNE